MSTFPESDAKSIVSHHPVTKGFVEVEGGLVHYVRRGQGPALVLLHAAPCSARVMAPLQALWGDHFTTLAFDLPGFGQSDMIEAEPLETRHLADRIAGAVRALGLTKVALYGRHTGAGVAVELAARHPDLCSFVLTDGFPVFAAPYSDERLAEYLPPITPSPDGGHLIWTWFRYREQHMFWPWDRPLLAHRADTDAPDTAFLHRGTIELFEAAETYQRVYASAFRHAGLGMIDRVAVPICFGNRPGDSQFKTLARYPASAWTQVFPREALPAAREELALLRAHARGDTPSPWRTRLGQSACLRDYVQTAQGATYIRGAGLDRADAPALVLHDLPGSIDLHADLIAALGAHRPTLGFDMAGNGMSTLEAEQSVSIAAWAEQAGEVIAAWGRGAVDVVALGASAAVALELAHARPDLVRKLVFRSPPARADWREMAETYAPDIAPSWEGAHLLRLWRHLRDQELWRPWNKPTIEHARRNEPRLDPRDLQRRAVALMQQPSHYRAIWRAALEAPTREAMARCATRRALVTQEQDLFAADIDEAAAQLGCAAQRVSDDASAAEAILAALQ